MKHVEAVMDEHVCKLHVRTLRRCRCAHNVIYDFAASAHSVAASEKHRMHTRLLHMPKIAISPLGEISGQTISFFQPLHVDA